MRKTKWSIVTIICFALFLTLFSTVGASSNNNTETSSEIPLEEQLNTIANQIISLQEQVANLQANMSQIWGSMVDQSVDDEEIDRQTKQTTVSENYMFQIEYYNTCLIVVNIDLLSRQKTLTEKQLEVEKTRLVLGISTQSSVDAINARLSGIKQQIEIKNETLRTKRQTISKKIGDSGYEFIKDYSIPVPGAPTAGSKDELIAGLIKNNASLNSLTSQIRKQNDLLFDMRRGNAGSANINTVRSQIELLNAQQLLLIKQLELSAMNKWLVYLNAKLQFELAEAARPMLAAQIDLLDEIFRLGKISEVEWIGRRFSIYEEQKRADKAAIELVIATTELDYMMKGVTG